MFDHGILLCYVRYIYYDKLTGEMFSKREISLVVNIHVTEIGE